MVPAERIVLVLRYYLCWFIRWHGIWLVPIVRDIRCDNNLAIVLRLGNLFSHILILDFRNLGRLRCDNVVVSFYT